MITRWKLFNFKSVQKETDLVFAPLTIFAGVNSSGKSTILQSILLVSQTLSHRISSRSVVLNGSLVRLGQFDDLRSAGAEANQIAIGWECRPLDMKSLVSTDIPGYPVGYPFPPRQRAVPSNVTCQMAFDSDPSSAGRDLPQLHPRLFSCSIQTSFRDDENVDSSASITITRSTTPPESSISDAFDTAPEDLRKSREFQVTLDATSLQEIKEELSSAEPIGCVLRHFLPDRLAVRRNIVELEAQLIASIICESTGNMGRPRLLWRRYGTKDIFIPSSAIAILRTVLADAFDDVFKAESPKQALFPFVGEGHYSLRTWIEGIQHLPHSRVAQIRKSIQERTELQQQIVEAVCAQQGVSHDVVSSRLPVALQDASSYTTTFFSTCIKYLGPLRDEPKPLYPLATATDPSDVGLRGEFTAAVLDLHKGRSISYIPTSHFSTPVVDETTLQRSLEVAVSDWLNYLGVGHGVESIDRGKLGHELKVHLSQGARGHDLTHVGVGVSQVLPILVSCLLAEPGTTIILEQPELHLHPRVQTLLADFFLSLSFLKKQCLIETHSEYLINRLRFRTASAPATNSIASRLKLYFVEKVETGSVFREVVVNDYGAITDWPEGFFDQSQREAEEILRAASVKRKKLQKGGKGNA